MDLPSFQADGSEIQNRGLGRRRVSGQRCENEQINKNHASTGISSCWLTFLMGIITRADR